MLDAGQLVVYGPLEGEDVAAGLGAEADEGHAELAVSVLPALGGVRLVVLLHGRAKVDVTRSQSGQQGVRIKDAVLDLDLVESSGSMHGGSLVGSGVGS